MLPPLEPLTLVLIVRGARAAAPAADGALDRLQLDHTAYLTGLVELGKILVYGPVAGHTDPDLRSVAVFRTSPEETHELMRGDPAVLQGRLAVKAMTWWVDKDRMPG